MIGLYVRCALGSSSLIDYICLLLLKAGRQLILIHSDIVLRSLRLSTRVKFIVDR